MPQKSVLFLFAKGDLTVPNPTTTAILRAGDLADRTIFFRNDLALAEDPQMSRNPHGFAFSIADPSALAREIARGAQQRVALFLASGGELTSIRSRRASLRCRFYCLCLRISATSREGKGVFMTEKCTSN